MNAAGFWSDEVNPLGPAHAYDVAPVAAPVSVRLEPSFTGLGVALALTEVGAVLTVTVTVADVLPTALVAVKV